MLVAQLTDLHLLPAGVLASEANATRFVSSLETVRDFLREPDLYVVTGDIADRGDVESYRAFLRTMADLDKPWLCLMGNHDRPENFAAAVDLEYCATYQGMGSFRLGQWRLVCVNTSLPGEEGGVFSSERADQLEAELAADPEAKTIIAMHHPPVATGVEWIDPPEDAAWIKRFAAVVTRWRQVRHIMCGHVHMAVTTHFNGVPLSISPSTAPQLWPETAPFDAHPDGRVMVHDGQPGFTLHQLGEGGVTTTFAGQLSGQVWLRHNHEIARTAMATK